ncbi:MAG UNVERIFIED_CONTAM: transglycosylase SLT domain-containing protein [Rickettsiaceae bacterium]
MNDAEKKYGIPSGILMAISRVESGMNIFSLNINGRPYIAKSQNEAVKIIKQSISSGISNVDIGIMQINYRWHGKEFASLEDMLKPSQNIDYAAAYLRILKEQHGSWKKAIRYYHSAQVELGKKYSQKVILTWINRHKNSTYEGKNV